MVCSGRMLADGMHDRSRPRVTRPLCAAASRAAPGGQHGRPGLSVLLPHLAALVHLFLPDGHGGLELVDGPRARLRTAAGCESTAAATRQRANAPRMIQRSAPGVSHWAHSDLNTYSGLIVSPCAGLLPQHAASDT